MAVSEVTGRALSYGEVVPAGTATLLVDDFTGVTLDSGKWTTSIFPNASVTQNNRLELNNQTGSSHSGAHVRTVDSWDKSLAYEIQVKWKPHTNHYGSAHAPYIAFVNSTLYSTNGSYGDPSDNHIRLSLGDNNDTSNRTKLHLYGFNFAYGQELGTANINIDESQWHDIIFVWNATNRSASVSLNGSEVITKTVGTMPDNSSWTNIKVVMGTCDYDKNNSELFDDFVLNYA